jgi:hypothetical protein
MKDKKEDHNGQNKEVKLPFLFKKKSGYKGILSVTQYYLPC